MRGVLATIIAAVTVAAAPFSAASAAPVPTLKRGADREAVEAWVAEHIDAKNYVIGILAEDMVDLYDPTQLERLPNGHLLVSYRNEYFAGDRKGYRSAVQRTELDCELNRFKTLSETTYALNNLQGKSAPAKEMLGGGEWSEPLTSETENGEETFQVCSFAPLVGSTEWARAMPPTPADGAPDTLAGWIKAHLSLDGYLPLTEAGSGQLAFFSRDGLKAGQDGRLQARIRTELTRVFGFGASGLRSSLHDMEIDCAHRRYLGKKLAVYPGANLLGPAFDIFGEDASWISPLAGDEMAIRIRALCRLSQSPGTPIAEARSQPVVPAPAGTTEDDVQRWVKTHINTTGYFQTGGGDDYVTLVRTDGVKSAGGVIITQARIEWFETSPEGYRSLTQSTEVDCRGRRFRFLDTTFYAQSNLEGFIDAYRNTDRWEKVVKDSAGEHMLVFVCGAVGLQNKGGDPGRAAPPEPANTEDDEVAAWIAAYVDLGDDIYVAHTDNWVTFYAPRQAEWVNATTVRLWIRDEYFAPQVQGDALMRSTHEMMEIDCAQKRWRSLAMEIYPGSNNLGPGLRRKAEAEPRWAFIEPSSVDSMLAAKVCRPGPGDLDTSLSEPQLPSRREKTPL